jgi:sporulation protein YlmC with PRC-barrel domain
MPGEAPATQSLAKMIHAPLRDAEGKAAGEIADVMVNFEEARVAAIVIQFDPKWLEMTGLAAVAPSSIERKDDGYLVKFRASDVRPSSPDGPKTAAAPPPPLPPRARLTQAPADALAKIPAENLSTARRMLGASLVDPSGKPVGKVEDVVIELSDGSAKFIVASFDPSWVASGWLVALKVRPIEAGPNGHATMKANLNEINFAFLFQAASWPDFSDPAAREMIRAKLGV